jgi:hypothetical protein
MGGDASARHRADRVTVGWVPLTLKNETMKTALVNRAIMSKATAWVEEGVSPSAANVRTHIDG